MRTAVATEDHRGRVTITWPAARPGGALPAWGVEIRDTGTGDLLPGVIALRISIGALDGLDHDIIDVELDEYADEDNLPQRGQHSTPLFTDAYKLHLERMRDATCDGRLSDAQYYALDSEFTGDRYRTCTSRYHVTAMHIAAPFGHGDH